MMNRVGTYIGLALVGVFFSMPLMCLIMIITALKEHSNSADYKSRYVLYALLTLVPALINTTKPVNSGDLGYYFWLYEFAGIKSFSEYYSLIPKEPIYHIYNYLLRQITFGDFRLFVIVTSMIMYLPVMFAFDIIVRKKGIDGRVAISAAVLLLMFPQFFFYTMQIVRQILAGSIAFYCVVKSIYDDSKLSAFGVFCAGFIHASAFIFCIYYVFLWTREWNILSKMLLLVACGAFFYSFLGLITSSGMEDSTLVYAAQRGLAENSEMINVRLFPRLVSLSVAPIGLFLAMKMRDQYFNTFISVSWIILGFIALKWNTPLFVLRFMAYAYLFLPICVALFMAVSKKTRFLPGIVFGMILYFFISLSSSNFTYLSTSTIFLRGILLYFI